MSSEPLLGFVPEPNCGRGTISIIWSCLATISLCVYAALHFNVPKEKRLNKMTKWKAEEVAFGIMAPELITLNAVEELYGTRLILKEMHKQGMSEATYLEAYFLGMGGVKVNTRKGNIVTIRWDNAIKALKSANLRREFPTREEIKNKAKQETIGKVLAMCQIIWFLAQVIGRHAQGYEVSLLEVSTISYIVLTTLCYLAWFRKPFGISEKVLLDATDIDVAEVKDSDAIGGGSLAGDSLLYTCSIITCLIFSGIHCVAWNYRFPSVAEAWLWRVSSLVCFFAAVVFLLPLMILEKNRGSKCTFLSLTIMMTYIAARMALIVLAFTTFRAAPASIYASVDWTHYISFIG